MFLNQVNFMGRVFSRARGLPTVVLLLGPIAVLALLAFLGNQIH